MIDPAETPSQQQRGDLAGHSHTQDAFDTHVAHPARIYDYLLGGKDHFPADRAAGEKVIEVDPNAIVGVRANRAFLRRAVEYLVREAGIRQFLDIGTGLPTADNTHEVAQQVAPDCRVVYVDNDPIVLVHARALLASSPEGATSYVEADARDTTTILDAAAQNLDLTRPVAVMTLTILQYIPDSDAPHQIVARLMDAMPSGSYLTVSDVTRDVHPEKMGDVEARLNQSMGDTTLTLRTREEFARYFDGLELVDPGVVPLGEWRSGKSGTGGEGIPLYAGMAHKP